MTKNFENISRMRLMVKVVLICSFVITILLLGMEVIHWGCWYLILRMGRNCEEFYILGQNYYGWAEIGKGIQSMIPVIYMLFPVIMGCVFVAGKASPGEYVYGHMAFFLIPVTVAYLFMVLFDPAGVTGGIETLIAIPFRKERWFISLLFGGVGACIWKRRNYAKTEGGCRIWRDAQLKLVFVFAFAAILLNVAVFVSDWIPSYLILAAGEDALYHKTFGLTMTEWNLVSGKLQLLQCVVSILFTVLFGIVMIVKGFHVKKYFFGIILFYMMQVWVSYFLNTALDPQGMTNAVDHLLHIPLRYLRWGIVGVVIIWKYILAFMHRQE